VTFALRRTLRALEVHEWRNALTAAHPGKPSNFFIAVENAEHAESPHGID
jgi:hypothetical protein